MSTTSTTVMSGKNTIRGSAGYAYATINSKTLYFANLKSIKAELDIAVSEVKTVGSRMVKHKQGMITGTYEASFEYNMPQLRKLIKEYKATGASPRYNITIVNDDSESAAKKQASLLKDCLIENLILAELDADTDNLEEDVSGTFDDFDILTEFTESDNIAKS